MVYSIRMKRDEIFAEVYAATNSPSKAMIASEPALKDKPEYAKVKANRLLKKPDMKAQIDKKLQLMSKKALKRIDEMITSDNETIATANSWKIVEHNIGTPIKRNVNMNVKANIEDALFDE